MASARASTFRSIQYLWLRYVLRRRVLLARARHLGLRIEVHAMDVGGRHLFKRGAHEEAFTRFLLQEVHVRDGAVVLDIGANVGWYSLLLARRFPGARVLAFEPEPENHRLLLRNLQRNGCGNVQAFALAIGDRTGDQELFLYPGKNTGKHSLLRDGSLRSITVRTVRLDDFLAGQGIDPAAVEFVKIDIEGFEYQALKAAPRLLAARPTILSEYSPKHLAQGGVAPRQYLELLAGAGFRPGLWQDDCLQPVTTKALASLQRSTNVVWQKDGSY